jgi:hypothetical protein
MSPVDSRIDNVIQTLVDKHQPSQLWAIDRETGEAGMDGPMVELVAVCQHPPTREKLRRLVLELEQLMGGHIDINCLTPEEFEASKAVIGRKACLAVTKGRLIHPKA